MARRGSQLPPIVEASAAEEYSDTSGSKARLRSSQSSVDSRKVEESNLADTGRQILASKELQSTQGRNRPKSCIWHLLSLMLSFLWLVPVTALLVLNFKHHVIGASVWCPFGRCPSEAFDSDAIATAVRLDQVDRDVLAGLQFVAQAFEIWFLVIATAFMYDVVIILAGSRRGLPVGYMLANLEFTHLPFLFESHVWTSAFGQQGISRQRRRRNTMKLLSFALLAASLCIITSLMDAAIAVLLLPSLNWEETERVPQQKFSSIAVDQAPQGDGVFANMCNNAQLRIGNYSCTSIVYGPSLDEWAATAQSSVIQSAHQNSIPILGTSQEAAVQFALNISNETGLTWVANRQALRHVSSDFLEAIKGSDEDLGVTNQTRDGPPDSRFTNSLQTILQRTGPSLGVAANCFAGNVSITQVGVDKEVHCFNQWFLNDEQMLTKCLRIGQGFNSNNNQSKFWLGSGGASSNGSATAVDAYFSDLATFFNTTTDFGSGILPCLANDTAPSCDWNRIFTTPLPTELHNSSVNVGLIAYSIPNPPNSQARIYCDAVTYLSFPTYSLDTSISSNELHLVQLDQLEKTNDRRPLVVSPDWLLAAWSVDRNGTVDGTRLITRELRRVLQACWYDQSDVCSLQLLLYHLYALGQAMSLVNYHSTAPSPESSIESQGLHDPDHPIFGTWARLHVWVWDLSERTSKLGVVITLCGCIVVLARCVLGLVVPRRHHSPVELFVAALEHRPDDGVFVGMKRERDMARVRFMVREEANGRPRFVPLREEGGADEP